MTKQLNYRIFFTILTASKASFTSWTRKIFAPFSNAIVFADVVAFKASFAEISNVLYNIDFLEIPAKMGASKLLKRGKFLRISKL